MLTVNTVFRAGVAAIQISCRNQTLRCVALPEMSCRDPKDHHDERMSFGRED